MLAKALADKISIHTSPKGGDVFLFCHCYIIIISIHTSPKGGDTLAMCRFAYVSISIHTSPKGGDAPAHALRGDD